MELQTPEEGREQHSEYCQVQRREVRRRRERAHDDRRARARRSEESCACGVGHDEPGQDHLHRDGPRTTSSS
eukprot:2310056-Heterocapsa_arctica.AAC.1